MPKTNPFSFVESVSYKKNYLPSEYISTQHFRSDYNAFIINRALSYSLDSVMFANVMNHYNDIDYMWQYDFYYHSLKKRKRFGKWAKPAKSDDVDVLVEYYKCNRERALEYLSILSVDQLNSIRERLIKGG